MLLDLILKLLELLAFGVISGVFIVGAAIIIAFIYVAVKTIWQAAKDSDKPNN